MNKALNLLSVFIWRDLKIRYKQTALGVLWVILQPLILMGIFTVIFQRNGSLNPELDTPGYMVFVFAALVFWSYFANTLLLSSNSFVSNSSLVTKVAFPRYYLPLSSSLSGLADLALASVLFLIISFALGASISLWFLVVWPIAIAWTILLTFVLSLLLATINVRFRDIRYALPFVVQIMLFTTPILYPLSLVPDTWQWVLFINPLTGIVEFARTVLGTELRPETFISLAVLAFFALLAQRHYKKRAPYFAEIL